MNVAVWDIETTDLKGDIGRLLCAVVYDTKSRKYQTFRADDYPCPNSDDRQICLDLRDCLESFPITCGWYSKGFDITFLNTRLIEHGERKVESMLHIDGIWAMKGWRGLNPRSSRLAVAAEFFNLSDRKPSVDVKVWQSAAMGGDIAAMDELVSRCKADVKITWQVTEKLLEHRLIKNIQTYP